MCAAVWLLSFASCWLLEEGRDLQGQGSRPSLPAGQGWRDGVMQRATSSSSPLRPAKLFISEQNPMYLVAGTCCFTPLWGQGSNLWLHTFAADPLAAILLPIARSRSFVESRVVLEDEPAWVFQARGDIAIFLFL